MPGSIAGTTGKNNRYMATGKVYTPLLAVSDVVMI